MAEKGRSVAPRTIPPVFRPLIPHRSQFRRTLALLAIALIAIGSALGGGRFSEPGTPQSPATRRGGDHAGSLLLASAPPLPPHAIRTHDSAPPAGASERRADGRGPTPVPSSVIRAEGRLWPLVAGGPVSLITREHATAPTVAARTGPRTPRGPPHAV